ncbi:MAG: S-layer homology domain-containing protein [Clostridiales bacterium]|nr:S-layer homology domain-containing protein [Clostridiales bacterium]
MRLLMVSLIVMMIAGLVPGGLITPFTAVAQMSVMQKTEANIVWVSPGSYHFAALDDDGRVWTWATNATGRDALGRTYTTTSSGTAPDDQGGQVTATVYPGETLPYIVQLSSSYRNSYALDQEGNIWSWGLDSQSALGRSGSGALPGRVSLPSGIKAKWIGAGYFGCKFIDMEGDLWVFGSGSQNSLGIGATADQLLPVRLEEDVNGNSLLGLHFAMVESSDYIDTACALAITEDGKLYTWGRTTNSNLYPADLQSAKPRYIGTYNTSDPIGAPDAAAVYPVIPMPLGSEVKTLTCGNGSMGFLTSSGEAYSWGTNSNVEGSGRLGQGHISPVPLPTKITNVNNALTSAPLFVSFSIYAWSSSAVDVNGVIYGAGANHGSKHGSIGTPNWLTSYTPTFITSSWQPRIFIVSEGYYGTQWIDVHGNCYSRGTGAGGPGGGTTLEPWVKFVGAGVPMFTRLDSDPPIHVKRYTDMPGNTLTVELDRPADEVRYVILYPDDTDMYTFPDPDPFGAPIRERFYDLSFMEFTEPYHFRDTYPQLLLSPNYDKPESRYYANPKITNAVFEEIYSRKTGDNAGDMVPNASSRIFEKQNLITGNCIVWVQSKNSAGTTRMVYRIDNFYTSANVWVQGVLPGSSPAQDVLLYGPRLAPGPYGIPLNQDKDALAYTEPPLGWDVVQPDPLTDSLLWPVWMYYTLDPAGQADTYAVADAFGVHHRIDPSKEVILDSLDKLTETRTPETTVTFSYSKNPDLWADVNLHFIYDDGSPVSFDGVTPSIPVMETREMMIPIAPARLSDIDPYFPPEAYDENDAAVGYYAGTPTDYTLESPLVYAPCTFPDGFNPALSAAAPVDICIIYKKGLLNVSETFWRITDKGSDIRTQITNNQGLASIRNAFEPSSVVSRNGSPIENNILFGYELWKESASGYSFAERHTYEWLSPDPLATGHYAVQAAVIADLEGSDWEIRWLYYPDEHQVNGIPDEDEASIVVNWYGRSATGAQSVLKSVTVWDLAGTAKNFTENKFAHLAEPERWILATAENYLSYLPPGNPSPTGTILLTAGSGNPSVYFWYNIDANENGLIDEDEYITVRHRLYGEDQNNLGKPDVVVQPFLLGDIYYGSPTAHVIPGYTAVGWCADVYDNAMPDEELHLIESIDDSLSIYFETDPLAGNGQIMTILYMGIAAPITIRFRLVTYTGTEFEMPPQILTGLVGQDVTALVQDPVTANPMWILDDALSVLPPDSRFVLRNTPQEFLYHYKENLTYSFITVVAASTDDRLSFEYPAIRELATAAPFPVQADAIPNYVVTGYTLYNANGVQIKTGLGDVCSVDPRDGHQRLVFTYVSLDTEVYVKCIGPEGQVLDDMFYTASIGQKYAVRAPYISSSYSLVGDLMQIIDPVLGGTNAVVFQYAYTEGARIEFYEVGKTEPILQRNVTSPFSFTESYLEGLLSNLWQYNAEISGIPLPLNIDTPDMMNEEVFRLYFDKILVPVMLVAVNDRDSSEIERITKYYDHSGELPYPSNWLRAGEMDEVVTEAVLGYTLKAEDRRLEYIEASSTFADPQEIEFLYLENEMGLVRVLMYYDNSEANVLQEYTIQIQVGSAFTASAPPSYPGFTLTPGQENPTSIFVEDGENTIKFHYDDLRKELIVKMDTKGTVEEYSREKLPVGTSRTIWPPYKLDHVAVALSIDGGVTKTNIGSGYTGYDITLTDDTEILFYYLPIAEVVDDYVIVVTVRGVTMGPDSSELYSYTTFKAKNSGAFTVNALPYNGYVLLDPSSSPANLMAAETPITQTFTYQSLTTTVTVYAEDGNGNPIPGFSPINVPATEGQPFSYNAPYILGWNLTGAATQTIPAVAAGGNSLTFVYAQASGNVTVILKENNAAGQVIKTLSMDLNIGNSPLTVPIPDLSGENYSLVTVPAQSPTVLTYDGNAHEVEYYYTKSARAVSLRTIDITDPGQPVQIGSDIAAGSYSVGEVASFDAPTLTGYKLESTTPLLVMITAGGGVQIVEFNYTSRAEGELVVQSVYSGDGTILQTYTITGTVGQSFSVPAPSLAGYKLAAAEPPSKTGRVPDTISFTYDKDTVTVTVALQDKDAVLLMPAENYELARGLTHTVYAPHLPGYMLISAGSIVFTDISGDQTAVFIYESLAPPESREIGIYTSLDEAAPVHHETLRIIQGEDAEIYAPYLNGYILIGYMLDAGGRVPVTSLSENTVRIPNVHSDGNLIFYYQSIDTYVEEEYVNIIVRGVDKANGTGLYSHTVTVRKSDTIKEIKAFEVAGYTLIPPASVPLVSDGGRAEVVFEYTNQSTYVVIKAELLGGGQVPGFSDIYVPAQIGQQFSYYAPYIPGYLLQDELIKILSNVGELDSLTFLYDESLGNVLILLKENNADGKVIKAISESLEIWESAFYSADSYDLTAEFYTAIGSQTCEVEGGDTWTTIEFYYERMMRGVDIELFNRSSNSVIGYFYKESFPIGDVAVIRAPGVAGLMLESDNPAFVLIQEGPGNQTQRFDYTEVWPDSILVYAVNDAEPNEILHSFSMNGDPGATLRVNAPIVPGYRLKAGEKYTVEQTVPGVVIFPYEEDFGAYATVNYVLIDHQSGKEIAAPQWIETQYTVLVGSDFTAQAPQLPGYQIVGNQTYKQRVEGVIWTVEFYYMATHDPATVTVRYLNRSSANTLIKEEELSGYYVGQPFAPKEHVPETFNHGGRRYTLEADPLPPVILEAANVVEVFYLDAGPERLGGGETIIEQPVDPEYATLVIHCTDIVTGQLIFIQLVNAVVGKEETISSPLIEGYSLDASSPATQTIIIEKGDNIVNFTYVNLLDLVLPAPPIQLPPMSVPVVGPVSELFLFLNEPPIPLSNLIMETFETEKHISYIFGYPDGTMRPDMAITRAEAAVIFWRLLKSADKDTYIPQRFPDVENGQWYAQAVNYLASIQILVGFEDGTFRPHQMITRAEFAAIASRFDGLTSGIDNPFADVPETHWARESIVSAYAKGWINGYPGGEFQPGASITRAEVVAVVNRMMGRALNSSGIPLEQFTYYYADLSPSHWAAPTIMEASVYHEYEVQGYEIWTLW